MIAKRLCEISVPLDTQDGEWEIATPRNYPQEWLSVNALAVQVWHWFAMDEVLEQAVIARLDEMLICAEEGHSDEEEGDSNEEESNESSESVSLTPRDKPTMLLLENIWNDEAEHIVWAQQQMQLMSALGPENYLATLV